MTVLFTYVLFGLVKNTITSFIVSFAGVFRSLPTRRFLFRTIRNGLLGAPIRVMTRNVFTGIVIGAAMFIDTRVGSSTNGLCSAVFVVFVFTFLNFRRIVTGFSSFDLTFFTFNNTLPKVAINDMLAG